MIFLCFVAQAFITSSNASSSNYSSTSSSSYTSPTVTSEATDDDEVIIGQYSCTSYHSDQAGKLSPSTYEKNRLDTEEAELTRLNNEIDNTSVDEYSEYSVNSYNQKIRNYKTKLQEFNDEIVDYNSSVEIYNNYLTTNCKKRY